MEKKIKSNLAVPFEIAGASLGMGLVGKGLGYAPLEEAGAVSAKFVGPATNIAAVGLTIGMLKELKEIKHGSPKKK